MSELVYKIGKKKLKRIMRNNNKITVKKPEEKLSVEVLKLLNIPEEFH